MKNLFLTFEPDAGTIAIFACVLVSLIIIIIALVMRGKKNEPRYKLKSSLMTRTEAEYFRVICAAAPRYIVLPQVNLASVIDKEGGGFRTELFRNADFGIFDENYRPVALVEINDDSHFRKDREERDEKVASILKKVRLPLITFWTRDGFDEDEIKRTLSRYL